MTTKFQLTMRTGPVPGKTYLLENEESTLGRDLSTDIPISDPEVSRRHARFFKQDDNFFIEDLGSTNGTFLNGERISSPLQLRKGDLITFGESVVLAYDKLVQEPDSTVVVPPVSHTPESEYTPPPSKPLYQREEYRQPEPQPVYSQSTYEQSVQYEEAVEPVAPQKKMAKKGGMPTWMIILLIAIVVFVCVIAVTLYFMPAAWWCAITFDALAGCPLP
jgi:pSer/pThr/pTyr-binding forkhead associated (FHA) protein